MIRVKSCSRVLNAWRFDRTHAECKMLDNKVTWRSEQPLRKHRAQTPFGNQQQPVHHRAQRIPFKTKPKTTWENSAQLLQAGFKREQERGLRYQGFDGLEFFAWRMRDDVLDSFHVCG